MAAKKKIISETDNETFYHVDLIATLKECVNIKEVYFDKDGNWYFLKIHSDHKTISREEILKNEKND
jgi:hypothetical protein